MSVAHLGTRRYWKGRAVMYRFYDADGRLLYVGATTDLIRRTSEHRQSAWWFQLIAKTRLQVFPDLAAAKAAESVAIQEEEPIANIVGTGRQSHDKSWPKWTKRDHALAEEFSTRVIRQLSRPLPADIARREAAERALAEIRTHDAYDALENVL